ncbi:DNA repair protein RecN [Myxococcota bacterium]|jgi:DNA repair protein RecN (Recombination protein N)|nr:DNA repair protein RecN [Myxococcota bacterium]
MLSALSIRNVAIIDSLDLALSPGLNALSGETGAGKSIVFAALSLVLGAKGGAELVRTGAAAAEVTARFVLPPTSLAWSMLRQEGLLGDGPPPRELVLRRALPASGPSRAWALDQPVKLGFLRQLAPALVDFAGQHAQQALRDPDHHLLLLDRFAGFGPLAERLAAAVRGLSERRRALDRLEDNQRHREERAEFLRFQLRELDALKPKAGEREELIAERDLQRHAVELQSHARRAESLLYSGDGAVVEKLGLAETALQGIAAVDPTAQPLVAQLAELLVGAEELARELSRRARTLRHDPARLEEIEGRLAELERLSRKHRCDPDGLVALHNRLMGELADLEHADERREELAQQVNVAEAEALELARLVRRERIRASSALEEAVGAQLRGLAMPHACFRVVLLPNAEGEPTSGGLLNERGLDRVELHLSANPGEEPRCLARVASGGELSRVLLALRVALQAAQPAQTFIFDEVDAGLGGAAAEVVGARLRELADRAQVLCITHLPQIASLADQHVLVEKQVVSGRTCSAALALGHEGRVKELARMVGGGSLTEASEGWARALLAGQARPRRSERAA